MYVTIHHNDMDGVAAAWAVDQHLDKLDRASLGDSKPIRVRHSTGYGEAIPEGVFNCIKQARNVYIVDFSYSRWELVQICAACPGRVQILDHHASAMQDLLSWDDETLPGNLLLTFADGMAGCVLAWHNLVGGAVPAILDYVEDRDLWRWQLLHTREINAWISSYPATWDGFQAILDRLEGSGLPDVLPEGRAVLRVIHSICDHHVNMVEIGDLAGYKAAFVNVTAHVSEVLEAVLEAYPAVDIAVGIRHDPSASDTRVSLRSRDKGPDVSQIAKVFGGGGSQERGRVRNPLLPRSPALASGPGNVLLRLSKLFLDLFNQRLAYASEEDRCRAAL